MFKPVDPKANFPSMEEKTIAYWKKHKTFEKSITSKPENKRWNFVDGPPFVTGMPHYGTLLSSIPKDLFGRYWAMKGYRVRRVWGWDGHGLPIENKVEAKLAIKRKKDIEDVVGVKKFIEECFGYVREVSGEWEWYVDHIGRWTDFANAYKTWDKPYMESVMWVFKQMYDKGYIYKGLRVSLYCPHCSTPISNFEVAMDQDNYKEVAEASDTYKYQVKGQNATYFLAWSTTPWTKLVTSALAVNPTLVYVKVKQGDAYYILAKTTLNMLKKDQDGGESTYEIIEEMKGKDLIGMKFEPHYDYYKIDEGKKAFEIIGGEFVTAGEGTGIVTIAAYGEDDLKVMQENQIQIAMHLDDEGTIKQEVPKFGGLYYLKANHAINEDLKERGLLYDSKSITHKIPTCWRCHTRLYYGPQNAWYVDIQRLKPELAKMNEHIHWFPEHFKLGRFLKSLEAAPDWCISRSRYWGSPVPVWECVCGERIVPGSIAELEKLSGTHIPDLHKPGIDDVVIPCLKCGKESHRVSEVLDSWIEAGSAPYAELHFPFEKGLKLEDFFPPDFIVEYTGQIRAWFYVLHVIGTAVFNSNAFKNVAVTGVILGTDGRKMSKNFGNYPDPKGLIQTHGGDALRLYLMGSPVMHGEDIIISEEQYKHYVRGFLLTLWNTYNFFVTYARVDEWSVQTTKEKRNPQRLDVLDVWVLSLLHTLVRDVTEALERYDTMAAVNSLQVFVGEFSTWYIRRSRERVGPSVENGLDMRAFYDTCYEVLTTFCQVAAPIIPFVTEEIFRNLTGEESVHLTGWPESDESHIQEKVLEKMVVVRKICELGHAARKATGVKVRQPLQACIVNHVPCQIEEAYLALIKDELNVKEVVMKPGKGELSVEFTVELTDSLIAEGLAREIVRNIQEERKKMGTAMDEKVDVVLADWSEEFEAYIRRKALVRTLTRGEKFAVTRLEKLQ